MPSESTPNKYDVGISEVMKTTKGRAAHSKSRALSSKVIGLESNIDVNGHEGITTPPPKKRVKKSQETPLPSNIQFQILKSMHEFARENEMGYWKREEDCLPP